MSLIDADYVRTYHNQPDLPDAALALHIPLAEDKIQDWVGQDVMDDAASQTPSDEKRARRIKAACAEIVMGYLALPINTNAKDHGLVIGSVQQNSSAFGTSSFRTANPHEERVIETQFAQRAWRLVRDYVSHTALTPIAVDLEDSE